ncbi:MAG TPA: DUF58 domain-containing protein [Tepidisphaeraceae bacterium]|nr:DUF58 domain-containing protein [Tepidisphaeraceae bacterium]
MSFVNRYLDPTTIQRLNQLQLSARRVVEGATTGMYRSILKGSSVEFRQHRFYVRGDEPRRLDWRVLGRTDRPYVKEYDEETNLRAMLVLDTSGSMGYGRLPDNKFDYACRTVASLAYLMLAQAESVGLATARNKILHWLSPQAGSQQLSHVVATLQRSLPHGSADMGACLHELAERLDRRSLVVIISDFLCPLGPLRQGLAHLVHSRHEVIALRILHVDERDFPFSRWTRFRGLEAEPSRLCEPAMTRKIYLDNFRRHEAELIQVFAALGVEFENFTTRSDLIESLTHFLRRRM